MTGDSQDSACHLGGIGDWLAYHAEHQPDREALIFGEVRLTCAQLDTRINRVANALAERGIKKGDRVALLMLNGNPFLESLFACARLGAIAVPLNYRLSPPEIGFILADAGAAVLIHDPRFAELVAPARADGAVRHALAVTPDGRGHGDDPDYEAVLATHSAIAPGTVVRQDDPLMMMYTSGTTGRPKGALLTHGNATWNCIHAMLSPMAITQADVVLTVAPLFHIGGLAVNTLGALYQGIPVVLQAQFEPTALLDELERERVSALFMLPAMWHALSLHEQFDRYDLSSLRMLVSGGAPCPIPVIEFFQQRGLTFCEGFGMTETTAGATILDSANAVRKHGSVGRPLTHMQARIVDDADHDVATGEIGELIVRGPNLFREYWGRPEATAEACRGGWFHTGDLARRDEEGFYYIVDRKKDMLISGGENVYPTEVEQVLFRHADIEDVAVVGVPDDRWGEVPMAFIVAVDGKAVTLEAVESFCRDRLARFKTPKHVLCVDQLPRTATGKLLKRELKTRFAAEG